MPLNTVNDMQLEEYQELFKDFFAFKREKGILEINSTIEKHTDVDIEQISKIELAILRQAIYELKLNKLDSPIIISEAIRLSKRFGQDASHKFINALLDKAAK